MGHTCAKDEIKQAQRAAIWKSGPKGPETSSILTYIRWKQVKIQIYFTSVRHICKYTAMPHRASSRALCGNICVPFLPLWWNDRSKPNVVWDSLHKYVVSKHIPRCSFRTSKCILSTLLNIERCMRNYGWYVAKINFVIYTLLVMTKLQLGMS